MALFASQLITAASGSVGGLTFLPTHSGLALRGKVVPVNPSSPQQETIRAALTYLANYWTESLTESERHAWGLYALHTPRPNRLGKLINLGGLPTWVRCQLPRLLAGLDFSARAPITYTVESFAPITPLTVASIGQKLIFAFDTTDDWVREQFAAMLIFISRPQNQSHNALNVSYRFAAKLDGSPFLPPTSPANVSLPFAVSIDQKIFIRVTVSRRDNRYTSSQYATATVT